MWSPPPRTSFPFRPALRPNTNVSTSKLVLWGCARKLLATSSACTAFCQRSSSANDVVYGERLSDDGMEAGCDRDFVRDTNILLLFGGAPPVGRVATQQPGLLWDLTFNALDDLKCTYNCNLIAAPENRWESFSCPSSSDIRSAPEALA